MKIIVFGALLFALTHAQEKPKDSEWRFEWVKNRLGEKRASDADDYLIQIRIPPIRERQFAKLKHFNPLGWRSLGENAGLDECIFEGQLESDPDSYVTVTGGCPGDDSFEILVQSKKFPQSRFVVKNGIGQPVSLPSIGQTQEGSLELQPPKDNYNWKGASREILTPPTYLTMNVSVSFDQTFKNRFGDNTPLVGMAIFSQVQNLLYSTSNLYRIRLQFTSVRVINISMQANKANLGLAAYRIPDKTAHSNIFVSASSSQPANMSIAYVGTVCSKYPGYRTSISEFYLDNITTASIVAHSIGHSLGMYNDFVTSNTSGRVSSQGYPCTNIRSIMEPGWNGVVWSPCSMEDFAKYYTTIMQTKGRFCLPRETPIDGNWGPWIDVDSCTTASPKRLRQRYCNNPTPQYGGAPCSGCDMEVVTCPTSTSVRVTALDAMTNGPISPTVYMNVYLNWAAPIPIFSSGIIPNVAFGTQIYAMGSDNDHLFGVVSSISKDIFNDGVMDITLMLSPRLAQDQMRMVLMWGEEDENLDLHGIQFNYTDGSVCHAYTGNRFCSGMTFNLDNVGRGTSGGEVITITNSNDLLFGFYVSNPNVFGDSGAFFNFHSSNSQMTGGGLQPTSPVHYWALGCVRDTSNYTFSSFGTDVDPQTSLMETCTGFYPPNYWSEWTPMTPCSQTCGPGTQLRTRNCLIAAGCQGCSLEVADCQVSNCNGVMLRLTALDVMTNSQIYPPPNITSILSTGPPINLQSPAIIPDVPLDSSVFAYVYDNNHLMTHYFSSVIDVFNDHIMDITLVMSPRLVGNQMRIAIMWGENEYNLDLHGVQYNLTDGTSCHASTQNRRCSGMTYNLDNIGPGMFGGEVITFETTYDLVYGFYVSNPNLFNDSRAFYNFWADNQVTLGGGAQYLSDVNFWLLGCILSPSNYSMFNYGSIQDPENSLMQNCRNIFGLNTWSDWTPMTPCSQTCGSGTQLRTRTCLSSNGCQGCSMEVAECKLQLCGGLTVRFTAMDVMTNGPLTNPVMIESYINWMNYTRNLSPAVISNVQPNGLIFATATDNSNTQPHFPVFLMTRAKDVLGTGIMDLTMMMGPRISPGEMRIILSWGEGDINLDLHGIQFNYTDGSVCHAYTGNRRCSGMTYNLDNTGRGSAGGETISFNTTGELLFAFYASNPNNFNNSDAYFNLMTSNYGSIGNGAMDIFQGHFWVIGCVFSQGNITLQNYGTDVDPITNMMQICRNIYPSDGWSQWTPMSPCSQTCGNGTQLRTRQCLVASGCQGCGLEVAQCQMAPCFNGLTVIVNAFDVVTNLVINPPVVLNIITPTNNTQSLSPVIIPNVPADALMTGLLQDPRFTPAFHMFEATDDYGTRLVEVAFLASPLMAPNQMRLILGWGQGAVGLQLYALQYNITDGNTCLVSGPGMRCSGMATEVPNFGRGSWGGQAVTFIESPELTYAFYASIPGNFNHSGAYIKYVQNNTFELPFFMPPVADGSFWKFGCVDGSRRTLTAFNQFGFSDPRQEMAQLCFGNLNPSGWGQWTPVTPCTQACGQGTQLRRRTCNLAAGCPGCSLQVSPCQSQSCLSLKAIDVMTWTQMEINDSQLFVTINGTYFPTPISVPMPPAGTDLSIFPTHPSYEGYVKEYFVVGSTSAAILMSPRLDPGSMRIVLGWGAPSRDWDLMAIEISMPDQQVCSVSFAHLNCSSASLFTDYTGSGNLGGEAITMTNTSSYIYGVYAVLRGTSRQEGSYTFYNGMGPGVYGDLRNVPNSTETFWSIGCIHGASKTFVPLGNLGNTYPNNDLTTTCVNMFNNGVWGPWSPSSPCNGPTTAGTQLRTRQCVYPSATTLGCVGCNITVGSCSPASTGDCVTPDALDKPTFKPIILNPSE